MFRLQRQLRWLIAIRLVAITSFTLPYLLYQLTAPGSEPRLDALLQLAGWTYAASLVYIALLRPLHHSPAAHAYIQFIGDLVFVTLLVYFFGGVSSPFSILYLAVIAVASHLLHRHAGSIVSTAAWSLYSLVLIGLFTGWIPPAGGLPPVQISVMRLTYNLTVHLLGFYAAAILTARLAETRRELEERSEDLERLRVVHRDVVQSVPSGLITTDLAGRITSLNRAGEEILGIVGHQLVGRPIDGFGLLSPEQWRSFLARNSAGTQSRYEVTWHRNGNVRFIGFSINELRQADGTLAGHILIFQDFSERRRLQEEIRMKDRMAAVGELAAGIAHEIGNPLAAISGSVQMLATDLELDSPRRQLLDIIVKESRRLDGTIRSFLQFARPKEKRAKRFDIAKQLAENMELLRNSSEVASGHRLELELEPASAMLIADPDQMSQIFWNLARNALRAMPQGGTLTVQGRLTGSTYRILFRDTGCGMGEEERANLFHPFHSLFDGGTGIGMAVVYRIVEEHCGRLGVSSAPDQGTEILVEVPVRPPSARPRGTA